MDGVSIEEAERRGCERCCADERVLGSNTFVARVASQLGLGRLRQRDGSTEQKLGDLLAHVAQEHAIEVGELRAGRQRPLVVRARSSFCQEACRQAGAPVAEVARYLGMTPRAVRYLAERGEEATRRSSATASSAGANERCGNPTCRC
jgi:hypothetical protein